MAGGAIASVRGYFDQKTFLEGLGLQVWAQPGQIGPMRFGRALWLTAGNRANPGAFSTTWIDVRNDTERDEVIDISRQLMVELAQWPSFIGATFTTVGNRLTTQTAWESEETAHRILRHPLHQKGLRKFFAGNLGRALHTSVWGPVRQNALWMLCPGCGRVEEYEPDGRSACGQPFPEQPTYW
jgi:hypothetical protein